MKRCILTAIAMYSINICAMEESKKTVEPAEQSSSVQSKVKRVSRNSRSYNNSNGCEHPIAAVLTSFCFITTLLVLAANKSYNDSCADVDGACADVYLLNCEPCKDGLFQTNVCYPGESLKQLTSVLDNQSCKYKVIQKNRLTCEKSAKPNLDGCTPGIFDKIFEPQTKREAKKERTQKQADSTQMIKKLLQQTKRQTFAPKTKHRYKNR